MEVFIGMDISLQETHICIVDGTGAIVHEGRTLSTSFALREYLRREGKNWQIKRIGFETGALSGHLYHELQSEGLPVVCMDARHAHGVLKAQRVKTDKNDARGLAQLVRTGWYRAVHVKSSEGQALRTLLAARKQLVKLRQDMENHIRGGLKSYGIKLGMVTQAAFGQKVEEAVSAQAEFVRQSMTALLAARAALASM
jgi:transposase